MLFCGCHIPKVYKHCRCLVLFLMEKTKYGIFFYFFYIFATTIHFS